MDERALAELADFYVGRMQHLLRLASVTDPETLARYIAALHFEMRPRFDELRAALEAEPDADAALPN